MYIFSHSHIRMSFFEESSSNHHICKSSTPDMGIINNSGMHLFSLQYINSIGECSSRYQKHARNEYQDRVGGGNLVFENGFTSKFLNANSKQVVLKQVAVHSIK